MFDSCTIAANADLDSNRAAKFDSVSARSHSHLPKAINKIGLPNSIGLRLTLFFRLRSDDQSLVMRNWPSAHEPSA